MDKETLSNYGWIVICVLVLAVMIALATPFGDYISTAVKSTTQGLFDTNKNALNSTGLINVGDQSFDDSASAPEIKREAGTLIPDGAKYTVKATNTVLEGNGTNTFPDIPATKDTYEEGDYKYTYNNRVHGYGTEWHVAVKDKTKTEYGKILSEIAGKPITNMNNTFKECTSLATAPIIPSSVTSMNSTFSYCDLKTAPAIPNGVYNMKDTFSGCTSLTAAPAIPNGVTNMYSTFSGCTSLITAPEIPSSVTDMDQTFFGCSSLTTAPVIPSSVTDMTWTFMHCTSLKTAPAIPNSVTSMSFTFQGCTSLTTVPEIPNSVTDMYGTFEDCTSLTGTIEINANPTRYDSCFSNTLKPIALTGSSTTLNELAATSSKGNITVAQ